MTIRSASDVIRNEEILCLHCHQPVKPGEKCVMYTGDLIRKIGKTYHGHMVYHEHCYIESELRFMTRFIMP